MRNHVTKTFNKIKKNKIVSNIILFIIKNKRYVYLFLSLYILDISTRIVTNDIGFVHFLHPYPNLYTIMWLLFIIFLINYMKNIYGKLLYGLVYGFSLVMFLTHNLYYYYFKVFFDFSVLSAASEGSSYLLNTLKDISWWMYLVMILSITLLVLSFKNFNRNRSTKKKEILIVIGSFVLIHLLLPLAFGRGTTSLEWSAWRNKRTIYDSFNDNIDYELKT